MTSSCSDVVVNSCQQSGKSAVDQHHGLCGDFVDESFMLKNFLLSVERVNLVNDFHNFLEIFGWIAQPSSILLSNKIATTSYPQVYYKEMAVHTIFTVKNFFFEYSRRYS